MSRKTLSQLGPYWPTRAALVAASAMLDSSLPSRIVVIQGRAVLQQPRRAPLARRAAGEAIAIGLLQREVRRLGPREEEGAGEQHDDDEGGPPPRVDDPAPRGRDRPRARHVARSAGKWEEARGGPVRPAQRDGGAFGDVADGGDGGVVVVGEGSDAGAGGGGGGEQQLVVLAAAGGEGQGVGAIGEFGGDGEGLGVDGRAHPRRAAQAGEIDAEAVGEIHRGGRYVEGEGEGEGRGGAAEGGEGGGGGRG